MQLPQFIKRALDFFEKAESQMNKVQAAEAALNTAKARITELEGIVAQRDTTITEVTSRAEKAEGQVTQLQGDLAKEKNRATAVIAGQGLPLEAVPAADPKSAADAAAVKETAWAKYQRLLASNPREAGAFWAENADQIIQSRVES